MKTNVNISNKLNFSDVYLQLHWVASKVDMKPKGVQSLCIRLNVFDKPQQNEIHSLNNSFQKQNLIFLSYYNIVHIISRIMQKLSF